MSADHPATAAHEIRGNICYDDHGDSPYWALGDLIYALDGGEKEINLEIDGEQWVVSVGYDEGGLEPRLSDNVDGKLREYNINAYGADERKLPIRVQPRLDWSSSKRPASVPSDLGLATNVKLQTAVNLEPTEIEDLIPRIMRGLAQYAGVSWNPDYFTGTPHKYSTITQYERYSRVLREYGKKVVKGDGIFHRMYHLLAREKGSKIVYSADNSEIVGYNHQLRLDRGAMSKLPDGLRRGMQVKHYHPEHVRKQDDSDPLYHPKIGALFKKGWNADTAVPWSEHRELGRELEEMVMNVLEWADVPTKGSTSFVSDWHFDADERSDREIALYDDPTPTIEASQESVLISTLTRISDRDQDVLERVAMTDGGDAHVDEIAEDTDWSTSTIYRALRKLGDLLKNENGNVSFVSTKIRERVSELVDQLDDTVEATTRIIEDTLQVDPRDLERKGRAWQNWLTRYGAELVQRGDTPDEDAKIRIREILSGAKADSHAHVGEVIDYGRIAWIKAGRDPETFDSAIVEFDTPAGGTDSWRSRRLIEVHGTG